VVEDGLANRYEVFHSHTQLGQSQETMNKLRRRLQAAWTWEQGLRALSAAHRAQTTGAITGGQWRELLHVFGAYILPLRQRTPKGASSRA